MLDELQEPREVHVAALVDRSRVEARLRRFLDAAPDATLVVDMGGRVVSANPQAVDLLRYGVDQLVGKVDQTLSTRAGALNEALVKVIARYKGFGMTDWKTVELKKAGEKGRLSGYQPGFGPNQLCRESPKRRGE